MTGRSYELNSGVLGGRSKDDGKQNKLATVSQTNKKKLSWSSLYHFFITAVFNAFCCSFQVRSVIVDSCPDLLIGRPSIPTKTQFFAVFLN